MTDQIQDFHTVGDFCLWLFSDGLVAASVYGERYYVNDLTIGIRVAERDQVKSAASGRLAEFFLEATIPTAIKDLNPARETAENVALPILSAISTHLRTLALGESPQQAVMQASEHRELAVTKDRVIKLACDGQTVIAKWRSPYLKRDQEFATSYAPGWLEAIRAEWTASNEPIRPLKKLPPKRQAILTDAELDAWESEALERLRLVSNLRKGRRR